MKIIIIHSITVHSRTADPSSLENLLKEIKGWSERSLETARRCNDGVVYNGYDDPHPYEETIETNHIIYDDSGRPIDRDVTTLWANVQAGNP